MFTGLAVFTNTSHLSLKGSMQVVTSIGGGRESRVPSWSLRTYLCSAPSVRGMLDYNPSALNAGYGCGWYNCNFKYCMYVAYQWENRTQHELGYETSTFVTVMTQLMCRHLVRLNCVAWPWLIIDSYLFITGALGPGKWSGIWWFPDCQWLRRWHHTHLGLSRPCTTRRHANWPIRKSLRNYTHTK